MNTMFAPYTFCINYISKMIKFKFVSMAFISAFLSIVPSYMVNMDSLFENASVQHLAVPIVVEAVMVIVFLVFTSIDAITGIRASEEENKRLKFPRKNVIQSRKLYRTIWKSFAVIFVTFMVCFFTLVCEILNSWAYMAFMWFLIWFWLLVVLFEWKSIGENLKRIDGHKPMIFMFMERLLNGVEENGLKRINKVIGGDDEISNKFSDVNEIKEDIDDRQGYRE